MTYFLWVAVTSIGVRRRLGGIDVIGEGVLDIFFVPDVYNE